MVLVADSISHCWEHTVMPLDAVLVFLLRHLAQHSSFNVMLVQGKSLLGELSSKKIYTNKIRVLQRISQLRILRVRVTPIGKGN
jgi:hypothetical protein